MNPFEFTHPDVAENYEAVDVAADFKIRVPQAHWPVRGDMGMFSTITPEVAEQLIKEGYNRIKVKS
jgi:hypothetical protein